jgi:hypothetical protein
VPFYDQGTVIDARSRPYANCSRDAGRLVSFVLGQHTRRFHRGAVIRCRSRGLHRMQSSFSANCEPWAHRFRDDCRGHSSRGDLHPGLQHAKPPRRRSAPGALKWHADPVRGRISSAVYIPSCSGGFRAECAGPCHRVCRHERRTWFALTVVPTAPAWSAKGVKEKGSLVRARALGHVTLLRGCSVRVATLAVSVGVLAVSLGSPGPDRHRMQAPLEEGPSWCRPKTAGHSSPNPSSSASGGTRDCGCPEVAGVSRNGAARGRHRSHGQL